MRDLDDLSAAELWKVVLALTAAVIGLAFIVVGIGNHYEADYAARCQRAGLQKVEVSQDYLCANPDTGALFKLPKE